MYINSFTPVNNHMKAVLTFYPLDNKVRGLGEGKWFAKEHVTSTKVYVTASIYLIYLNNTPKAAACAFLFLFLKVSTMTLIDMPS